MSFSNAILPEPTTVTTDSPPLYSNPSHSDLAAVAATVSVVGVLMALLVAWLIIRLRRASKSQSDSLSNPNNPRSTSTNPRTSLAPSETSSKFAFIRKPLRLSHRQQNHSWDFVDPDPFTRSKEYASDPTPSKKRRPAPLASIPAYIPRAHRSSTHKEEFGPHTPTTPWTPYTPASVDFVDPPPPAYCPDGTSWPLYHPKDLPLF